LTYIKIIGKRKEIYFFVKIFSIDLFNIRISFNFKESAKEKKIILSFIKFFQTN
jgi:hypothetical protein